jgi:hypothetical protein
MLSQQCIVEKVEGYIYTHIDTHTHARAHTHMYTYDYGGITWKESAILSKISFAPLTQSSSTALAHTIITCHTHTHTHTQAIKVRVDPVLCS